MMNRDEKIIRNAPCLFQNWDSGKRKWVPVAPAVDCSFRCDHCGWNPQEVERRWAEGTFDEIPGGYRYLIFKRRGDDNAAT